MLLRLVLFVVLAIVVARAFWRLVDGIAEGIGGRPRGGRAQVPTRGVQMVRDPVCGTFVLPDHAVTLVDGRGRLFFCSETCRSKYRGRPSVDARSSTGGGRPEAVKGRTA